MPNRIIDRKTRAATAPGLACTLVEATAGPAGGTGEVLNGGMHGVRVVGEGEGVSGGGGGGGGH